MTANAADVPPRRGPERRRPTAGGRSRRSGAPGGGFETTALAVLLALVAAAAGADVASRSRFALLPLVVAPPFGAVVLRWRATILVSVLATGLMMGIPGGILDGPGVNVVRLAAMVSLGALGAGAAGWRERLQTARARLVVEQAEAAAQRRAAIEVNDTLLQTLVAAHAWLSAGRSDEALGAVEQALVATRQLVTGLLGDVAVRPGDLVRSAPAEGPR